MCGFDVLCQCAVPSGVSNRGPDQWATAKTGDIYTFYFSRLAINGGPDAGQPFVSSYVGVCNGEIYNHQELRNQHFQPGTTRLAGKPLAEIGIDNRDLASLSNDCVRELKGHDARGDCDIIGKLIMKVGYHRAAELLGPSEFAWVFMHDGILYAARDTFGVRPMYTGRCPKCLALCLASTHDRLVDVGMTGIEQFPPGHTMKYDPATKTMVMCRFNALNDIPIPKTLDEALTAAVKIRATMVDGLKSVNVLLSGGIDSCTVLIKAAKFVSRDNLCAFTFVHDENIDNNVDLQRAKQLCEDLKVTHYTILISATEVNDAVPDVIHILGTFDTTTIRASCILYVGLKEIRRLHRHRVVFLCGEGADEMFGGYQYFSYSNNGMDRRIECERLLRDIHMFDGLRIDRIAGNFGMEVRLPFLDLRVYRHMTKQPDNIYAMTWTDTTLTKVYFRHCMIANNVWLNDMATWRKDALSDSVGHDLVSHLRKATVPSHYAVGRYAQVPEFTFADPSTDLVSIATMFSHLPPRTAEELRYRSIFDSHFHNQLKIDKVCPYMWRHRFTDESSIDPSARFLSQYNVSSC